MLIGTNHPTAVCLALTRAISTARTVQQIYGAALDALAAGLGVERSSILLFDPDGVMRFKAWRALSDEYREAVEGHTPWTPETSDAQPIVVPDVVAEPTLQAYLPTFQAEGIAAMTFIPLTSLERVIGKFMLYYRTPTVTTDEELQLAGVIAAQVAFAVERTRTEAQARRNEERLRFALDAASMGTWDWDLASNRVRWSDNLERIHGLPPGAFGGTFASYESEIHPDDRARVMAAVQRALAEGVPYEVEYRIVAPDGTVRWCEGKGRVEYEDGRPVRMTGVCMMVTRRKEAELARLAVAEESSRLKDEFLATLSHELRTPLNTILGWVQMLERDRLDEERVGQALQVIGRNARLQAQLIEDVLDVSRIIAGQLVVERVPLQIGDLIGTALASAAPTAAAKGVTLVPHVDGGLPSVTGDHRRLLQVLGNVLTNAVKFTPEGGTVEVGCARTAGWLDIQVRDSGAGIDPAFLPHVFDRFRQGDSRATRRHGGLGLGLAIARHLVEQHGGEIRVSSDGPGRGTVVSIRLPAATAPPAGRRADRQGADLRLDQTAILVVDDHEDSREMLAQLLEHAGARVVQSESALTALDLIASEAVQVLIADIAMPDVDGYELIRRVRARGVSVPAIALTAFARPEDRERALSAGYSEYCAKPIDGLELVRTIRNVIAN